MDSGGGLVSDAHVRPVVVVEPDVVPDGVPGLLHAVEVSLAVDHLGLDDSVDPLGHRVVRGLVVLGHADGDVVCLQHVDIGVAAVLDTAVRVVDEAGEVIAAPAGDGLPYGLGEGLQGG